MKTRNAESGAARDSDKGAIRRVTRAVSNLIMAHPDMAVPVSIGMLSGNYCSGVESSESRRPYGEYCLKTTEPKLIGIATDRRAEHENNDMTDKQNTAEQPEWYGKAEKSGELTEAQAAEGWHWCDEWDFMLIHKSWPEMQACSCSGLEPCQLNSVTESEK